MSDSVFMKIKRAGQLLGVLIVLAVLLGMKLACGHTTALTAASKPAAAPVATPSRPFDANAPMRLESLGSPIESSRTWATALAPNSRAARSGCRVAPAMPANPSRHQATPAHRRHADAGRWRSGYWWIVSQ